MAASKSSKSSRTSRRPAVRRPARRENFAARAGVPWGALLFLTVLSALAVFYFWRNGYLHWYGDASAHLNIARRILDGRTPGYAQIGTVWLPLPHVLMMPFASYDALWTSGLAGAIPNAICFVAAGVLLFLIARHSYNCEYAAWTALLLFALNPNLLYLQSLAMTEAVFVFAVLLTLYGSLRENPWLAGVGLLAGTMTRYEGWFLIPFVVLYFFWRNRWAGVLVGLIASIGPVYWLGHNYVFHGDALDFYHGVGSAKWIYQQSIDKGLERAPGDGDWLTAARYYAMSGRLFAGLPLAVRSSRRVVQPRLVKWALILVPRLPRAPVIRMVLDMSGSWVRDRKNLLFLKKKKQKDFHSLERKRGSFVLLRIEGFWFFFSKKTASFL